MFSRLRDCKSQFRILKGGKISLVVSALLVGSIITDVRADSLPSGDVIIDSAVTTTQTLYAQNLTVTESGSITVSSDTYIKGVSSSYIYTNTISNSGTISAKGSSAYGMRLDYMYDSSIVNSGNIESQSTGISVGIQTDMTTYSSITNTGTINSSSLNAVGIGISSFNLYESSIVNSGTITTSSENGYINTPFYIGTAQDSTIENSGILQSSGNNATGIQVRSILDNSNIKNSGTIAVDGSSGLYYSDVSGISVGGSNNSTITNSGTITATIDGQADAEAFSINEDIVIFRTTKDITPSVPLNVTNSGTLNGNISLSYNTTLTNSGTISLPHNATGVYSAAVGKFVNTSEGILEIGLLTDGTTTTYSQLNTVDATFKDKSTLAVNVLSSSTNEDLLIDTKLEDVVTASNSLTIEGTLNIEDNSDLLNFEYVEDGETIDLVAVEGKTIAESTIEGGGEGPTFEAANALDRIKGNSNFSGMNGLFTSLNKLGNSRQVASAVESLTPQISGAGFGAATQIGNGISGIVEQRQTGMFSTGANSGDELLGDKSVWFKPFGSWGQQDNKDGINGFDVSTYGFGIGADVTKDNEQFGIALFYARADVDVNNVDQSADIDAYSILGYGYVPIIDAKTKLLYQVGYSFQKTDSKRGLFTGDTARADYTSKVVSLDLKVMRDYQINDNLLFQPVTGLTYRYFTTPSYNESGAGAANLTVDKFSTSELLLGLGTMIDYKIDNVSKVVGNVNVDYDLQDKQNSVTSSFEGASGVTFDTNTIDNGRWGYSVGVGYERDIDENNSFNVSFDYEGQGSDYRNSTVSAKYVYKF